MKAFFFILSVQIIFCTPLHSRAAAPPLKDWQKCLGGDQMDIPVKIIQLKDGQLLLLSNVDSDNGDVSSNHGSTDIWLTKLDHEGHILWEKSLGGSSIDAATGMTELENGNIIISGYSSSVDFDINLNHGNFDAFVMSLDSSGTIQWVKVFGGSQVDLCYSLVQSKDGGFILGGGSFSHDGDLTSNYGSQDFWIIKTDSSGNLIWQKSTGGNDVDVCYAIAEDSSGNIYATGTTNSSVGTLKSMYGNYDLCTLKLDPSGNILWAKCYGGSNYETAQSILIDGRNRILLGGYSRSSNGNVTSNLGYGDSWILRIDENGNILDQKSFGGTGGDNLFNILATTDGGYLFTSGSTSADIDIVNHIGAEDIWLLKTDSNFNTEWSQNYGGTGNDRPASIIQNQDGGFLVTGYTFSIDGDVSGSHGSADIWLLNLTCKLPLALFGTSINICQGDTIQLFNSSSFASQSEWYLNNQPVHPSGTNQLIAPTLGIYDVTLNVQTCYYSASKSIAVAVNNCNSPSVNFTSDKREVCANSPIHFTDFSLRAISWQWDFPGGTPSTSSLQNPIITYSQPGIYNVLLTATNAFGSQSSMQLSYVVVHPSALAPTVALQGNTLISTPATTYQWYINGNAIPSANNSTYSISMSGYYTVSIENQNGCSAQSDSVYYSATGIQKSEEKTSFSVYPNPANKQINIKLTENERGKLSLVNAEGQKLSEVKIQGGSTLQSFELEMYPSGLYMIVFTDEKGKSVINSIIKL